MEASEELCEERAQKKIDEVANTATEDIGDDVGNVGGTKAVDEGLERFDTKTKDKSIEKGG